MHSHYFRSHYTLIRELNVKVKQFKFLRCVSLQLCEFLTSQLCITCNNNDENIIWENLERRKLYDTISDYYRELEKTLQEN